KVSDMRAGLQRNQMKRTCAISTGELGVFATAKVVPAQPRCYRCCGLSPARRIRMRPNRFHNQEVTFSQTEREVLDRGIKALATLKKGFYTWIEIGEAVVKIRDKADGLNAGRDVFYRLMAQQGFAVITKKGEPGVFQKATITRLEQIIANRAAV